METFLGNVADFILKHHKDADRLCVALPGRRAGLFLKKELASRIESPIWSPTIISIEDLFLQLSGLEKADDAELLLMLYEIVRKTPGHTEEPFDGFCKWAPALLSDFNDVDAWLADPKQLFRNLSEIKVIEHWSLGEANLTDFQKKYLLFWNHISSWYFELRDVALKNNKAWSGLIYRTVSENIQNVVDQSEWSHFIFAGFNALNKAEEKLFASLAGNNKADLLWDTDRYYMEDHVNEAGRFLRKYRDTLFKNNSRHEREFQNIRDHFSVQKKEITLIASARNVSQARAVSGYLENEGAAFLPDETAIVLADEQLLMPMLNAVPSRFSDVNITMGYPMRNTPVFTLLHILFSLQETAAHFGVRSREGELKFYHHDVIRLLRHPYIIAASNNPARLLTCIKEIAARNLTFVSPAQLAGLGSSPAPTGVEFLFQPWTDAQEAITGIQEVVLKLRDTFSTDEKTHALDIEYIYQLHLALNRVSTLFAQRPDFNQLSAIKNLLIQTFGASSIPFSGEPLHGLQVMGMLETRTLDFKNVIIVSANEGILPGSSNRHSFIMHDLRRAFELPLYNDREAVSAYHFYRTLQRAQNICLVYNTDQDAFGAKEKSRFVTQLQYELPKVNLQASFRSIIAGADLHSTDIADEISIQSSEEIVALIMQKSESGFSPSMINSFRECKLRFYFQYASGLYEADTVEESADSRTLGTIIHTILELLLEPYVNAQLTVANLTDAKSKIGSACKQAFDKLFKDEGAEGGKNLLAGNIARRYVARYLELEIARIKQNASKGIFTTVLALEKKMMVNSAIDGIAVNFGGLADRIDRTGNVVQLADYKTGTVERTDVTLKAWSDFTESSKKGKAFQLMMYAWLYLKTEDTAAIVQPGIISFRKLNDGFLNLQTPEGDKITSANLIEFENALHEITSNIISVNTVFDQTTDRSLCKNCPYNTICRRD